MIETKVTLRPVGKVNPGDRVYWIDNAPFKLEAIHSLRKTAKVEE